MNDIKYMNGRAGEEVTLSLPGGGGTGYAWKPLSALPPDTEMSKEYTLPEAGIGGRGTETIRLKFHEPGEHTVELGFTSPSGQEVDLVETFKFKID